ncbi:hypothetical protein MBLNU13_g06551t1 [Cladosporium sp. NU13]
MSRTRALPGGMFQASRQLRRKMNMASKPINLILDWDGTITAKDTMFAYGKIADIRDARLNREQHGSTIFEGFGKAWMNDYSKHEQAYRPKAHDRKEVVQESAWLRSLSSVESNSASRVESSGFFTGVTHNDISIAARELLETGALSLRPGWQDLFLRAQDGSSSRLISSISILSVNWSESFIRASLKATATSSGLDSRLLPALDNLPIAANEISGINEPGGSSGRLTDSNHAIIRTSFDKLSNFPSRQEFFNIYVGDSATDFDCLLAADLGICIRDDPMGSSAKTLAETMSRVGHVVQHVDTVKTWQQLNTSKSNLLWAQDLEGIVSLLERLHGEVAEGHQS